MDFRKATDVLFSGVTHADLAKVLGISVALIRQARLDKAAKAHRSPPEDWKRAVARLATQRAARLMRLAEDLKEQQGN